MAAELKAHLAFHLTGKRPSAGLDAFDGLDLRPALLARYRDLTTLRYDYPLVLVRGGSDSAFVQSLSGLVNHVLDEIAQGDDGERVIKHVLRLEQQIRALVAHGSRGLLSALWDTATDRLGARTGTDGLLRDSLDRARAALRNDGEVVDCDAALPARFLTHAWSAVQEKKAGRLGADVRMLAVRLSDILRADVARSAAGQSAHNLRASVGSLYEDAFDFEAMSRVLTTVAPKATLSDSRRRRIRSLVSVLESYEFSPDAYVFTNCATALGAYRVQLPKMIEVARAMAMAELEINGEYRESTHDALFAEFGAQGLGSDPQALARFPDYLVCVHVGTMEPNEQATLIEILSASLPMKILLQSDDILDESLIGDGHLGFGMRSRQLANMAISLNEVYVLQSTSSHLFQSRNQILNGLTYPGPALFSVFSGATGQTGDLPPYLTAAAAIESRAFPVFTYAPRAGADWASRFCLDANPQVDQDWPIQTLTYEDDEHQRISVDIAFTLVDFVASDHRFARHFAKVPRAKWNVGMIPVSEALAPLLNAKKDVSPDKVPCILMVDRSRTLQKVLVDEKLVREARRCREIWHRLQELGGIHDSHAERQLSRERKAREQQERREPDLAAPAPKTLPAGHGATASAEVPSPEVPQERSSDEPYIETPRCTTCNECTQINAKMFVYNENRQAYIADADAGTYAQLVEAAESCQVSIIHPGKPRNPNEPGLGELLKRAEVFR